MKAAFPFYKFVVAASAGVLIATGSGAGAPARAEGAGALAQPGDGAELDRLFAELRESDVAAAMRISRDIERIWSRSGSAAMDFLLDRGEQAVSQGDYEAALDHLTALTDHAPDFAEGWNERAVAWFHMGRLGPAVEDIRRTLALNPRHYGALTGFGVILEQLDQPQQALEVYRAALAIHPHLPEVSEAVKRLEAQTAGREI